MIIIDRKKSVGKVLKIDVKEKKKIGEEIKREKGA